MESDWTIQTGSADFVATMLVRSLLDAIADSVRAEGRESGFP